MKLFKLFLLAILVIGSADHAWASDEKEESTDEYVFIPFNASFVPGISVGDARANGRKIINRLAT